MATDNEDEHAIWRNLGDVALPQIQRMPINPRPAARAIRTISTTGSAQIDVDALAQAVLALMRHELRIERERLG